MQLLASPQSNLSDINGAEQSADHVVRLTAAVFRISEIEKMAIEANAAYILSPELSSSIMYFLHNWSLNYLMPNEANYSEISTIFLQAFGEESPGGAWTVNFLLEKVLYMIESFKGEQTLLLLIIQLLSALAQSQTKYVLFIFFFFYLIFLTINYF